MAKNKATTTKEKEEGTEPEATTETEAPEAPEEGTEPATDTPEEPKADEPEEKAKPAAKGKGEKVAEGAPEKPGPFKLLASLTVSKSNEDGSYFINFGDGRDPKSAVNPSQVNHIVTDYLNEKTL